MQLYFKQITVPDCTNVEYVYNLSYFCFLQQTLGLLMGILIFILSIFGNKIYLQQIVGNSVADTTGSTPVFLNNRKLPVQHVYYLKVHKCSSTTMQSIFTIYALRHNLSIVYFKGPHSYPDPDMLKYLRPDPNVDKYNMLVSHTTFQEGQIRQLLPKQTKFVTILRHPLSQLASVFGQFSLCKAFKLLSSDSCLETFLQNPGKYEHLKRCSECCKREEGNDRKRSCTKNFMASHFGYRNVPDNHTHQIQLRDWLEYLDERFDFIGFTEHMPESLVYLRRLFQWDTKDILTLHLRNKESANSITNFSKLSDSYKQWSQVDYMLYNQFYTTFKRKIKEAGDDFKSEVQHYVILLEEVTTFCYNLCDDIVKWISTESLEKHMTYLRRIRLPLQGTKWSIGSKVTGEDCLMMMINPDVVFYNVRTTGTQVCKDPECSKYIMNFLSASKLYSFPNQPLLACTKRFKRVPSNP